VQRAPRGTDDRADRTPTVPGPFDHAAQAGRPTARRIVGRLHRRLSQPALPRTAPDAATNRNPGPPRAAVKKRDTRERQPSQPRRVGRRAAWRTVVDTLAPDTPSRDYPWLRGTPATRQSIATTMHFSLTHEVASSFDR
jgi:hypothetical protein